MPYMLRKAPNKDAYWVVNKDTGKKHSKSPLPYKRARAQMSALYAVENGYILNRSKSKSRKMRGGEDQAMIIEGGVISGGKSKSRKSKSKSRKSKSKSPKRWVGKVTEKLKHPGSLSRKAERAGKDTHQFACDVLKSPSKYTDQTRRQAQFFVNINKHNKC